PDRRERVLRLPARPLPPPRRHRGAVVVGAPLRGHVGRPGPAGRLRPLDTAPRRRNHGHAGLLPRTRHRHRNPRPRHRQTRPLRRPRRSHRHHHTRPVLAPLTQTRGQPPPPPRHTRDPGRHRRPHTRALTRRPRWTRLATRWRDRPTAPPPRPRSPVRTRPPARLRPTAQP